MSGYQLVALALIGFPLVVFLVYWMAVLASLPGCQINIKSYWQDYNLNKNFWRSAMSLAVDSNEIGKIFSVLSLFGGFINSGIGKNFQL